MEIRTLKGVDKDTWMKFKMLALKSRSSMGNLLKNMIENQEKRDEEAWDAILNGEKLLTAKEAEEMHEFTGKLRKEWGFRNVTSH